MFSRTFTRCQTVASRRCTMLSNSAIQRGRAATVHPNRYLSTETTVREFQWLELGMNESSIGRLKASFPNVTGPSQVQRSAIPLLLRAPGSAKDVIIASETGSGKTLAYLLPLVQKMLGPEGKAVEGLEGLPRAVVLTSTRELCVQVQTVLTQLQGQEAEESQQLNARVVHGEQEFPSPHDQTPVDILITTPMCLAHNIRRLNGDKLASAARVVVWDEADMLLQGAFLKDSHEIVATLLRKERQDHTNKQFVFAGATFPTSGRKSVAAFLKKNFQNAEWAYGNEFHKARSNLEETWIEAPEAADKSKVTLQTLRGWLSQEDTEEPNGETLGPQRALVFTESATSAGRVHESLAQSSALAEVPVTLYHSKLKRDERQAVMNDFTNNEDGQPHKVLICTDLAARGIDYTGVSLVIQYDFASNVVGHFHRVGRAGRTWKDGTAMAKAKVTNLVAEKNQDLAKIVQLAATDSRKIQDSFSRRRGLRKRLKQRAKGETYKGQKI